MGNWYKSRTIWFAILQAIAGIIVVFSTEYPEIGYIATAKSVIDILLRVVTTQPLSGK